MKRRNLLLGLAAMAALATTAGAAFAATFAEDVVRQLARLGFKDITVETTLLGRIKIHATRDDGLREIVLNPRTGEILRDVWFPTDAAGQTRTVLSDIEDEGGSGSDGGGDDGDGDDGDGDDDDGDDGDGDDGGGDDGGDTPGPGGGDDGGKDGDSSGSGSGDNREDRQDRDGKRNA